MSYFLFVRSKCWSFNCDNFHKMDGWSRNNNAECLCRLSMINCLWAAQWVQIECLQIFPKCRVQRFSNGAKMGEKSLIFADIYPAIGDLDKSSSFFSISAETWILSRAGVRGGELEEGGGEEMGGWRRGWGEDHHWPFRSSWIDL